jgi:hypothetical protein
MRDARAAGISDAATAAAMSTAAAPKTGSAPGAWVLPKNPDATRAMSCPGDAPTASRTPAAASRALPQGPGEQHERERNLRRREDSQPAGRSRRDARWRATSRAGGFGAEDDEIGRALLYARADFQIAADGCSSPRSSD